MPKVPSIPSYRLHKPSGQAVVTVRTSVGRRDIYLGEYNSPDSRREYARLLAEFESRPITHPVIVGPRPGYPSVNEVLLAFLTWAATHYRTPDGKPTSEIGELKWSIRLVRELYGHTPAAEFGPKALAAVRQQMVQRGWCRSLINRRIDRVKRVFKWATSEELVPVTVYAALRTLAGLKKGRTEVRESKKIEPVDPAHVEATLPFLTPHLRVMVRLQQLTGMRPGEVCRLRLSEIDCSGEVWVYRPAQHKTAHCGKSRVVPFGPRARAVIVEFLRRDGAPPDGFAHVRLNDPGDRHARLVMADAYQEAGRERDAELLRGSGRVVVLAGCVCEPDEPLFSPRRAREERYRRARRTRKSKVPPSQQDRRKAAPKRVQAAEYTTRTYDHAVWTAAKRAGVPHWHPNQLRHTFATEVRKRHGLEAAQVLLGHSRADVTQVYAERDTALATSVAAKIG